MYTRRKGVICYEVGAFHNRRAPLGSLPSELASTGLTWYWTSQRDPLDDTFSMPVLPDERPWTLLMPETAPDLLRDVQELNSENYGRYIALIGLTAERDSGVEATSPLSGRGFSNLLIRFAGDEEGPIQTAIVQLGDQRYEYAFVPHEVSPPVQRLLERWKPTEAYTRRPYRWLHLGRLERLIQQLPDEGGPFFLFEGGLQGVFLNRREAERWLEAQDVEDGIYEFFTADGTELRLATQEEGVIVSDEVVSKRPERLQEGLQHALLHVPQEQRSLDDAAIRTAGLTTLVEEEKRLTFSRVRRDLRRVTRPWKWPR